MMRIFPKIELASLRSKVARRIFSLFVLCALLPLCIFAFTALFQVRGYLKEDTDRRLKETCKAAAMTVFERLGFIETDLDSLRLNLLQEQPLTLEDAAEHLHERSKFRFKSLCLAMPDRRIIDCIGPVSDLPEIDIEEQKHLVDDKTLLVSQPQPQGRANLYILRAVNSGQSPPKILYSEINPEYIWGGDGFIGEQMALHVLDENGLLLFSSMGDKAPLTELKNALSMNDHSGRLEWEDGEEQYLAGYWTLFLRPTFFNSLILVRSEKKEEILLPLNSFTRTFLLVALLSFWIVLFLSLNHIRKSMGPIEQLKVATGRIREKDFSGRVLIKSNDEFEELGASFNAMTDSIQNYINIMDTVNRIGISLSAEDNDHKLMGMVLEGARKAVRADGAALYLLKDDSKIELEMMRVVSLDLWVEKNNKQTAELYEIVSQSSSVSLADGRSIIIEDVYASKMPDVTGFKKFDARTGYRTRSLLCVPLKNHEKEIIGILKLINAHGSSPGTTGSFTDEDQRLVGSLASQAAVALTKNRLVRDFKQLFEGLTELIGTAVDEKSPYTGGHCKRVPELTLMLADAVTKANAGPLKNVVLTPEEKYELKIAALLHDCGKVTTPVHIADKATKLQTIVDRIELIQTRFEIIMRDKELELLREAIEPKEENEGSLSRIDFEKAVFRRQLIEEFKFLSECNQGTEFMPEESQNRILEIACKYSWEALTGKRKPALTTNEIYNLSIQKGTLTPRERHIINGHVATSIRMLKSLRYPKKLRNVPVHAGLHHECIDGTGYPMGLAGNRISLQGRMLAIADIFEALTAADRPYQKTKKLSVALDILRSMKDQGRIDPDLYDVFISEKIYLRYAEQYLTADQMDLAV